MIRNKSFKFRIYPTEKQKQFFANAFGCNRFIYNYFLDRRSNEWKNNKKNLNKYECSKELPNLKKEYPWLKNVNSQSLQAVIKNLDDAYINFFEKRSKYPKNKKKRNDQSVKIPQHFRIENDKFLHIPKLKTPIKIRLHRQIEGKIISLTINKNTAGDYFVSFQCQVDIQPLPKIEKSIEIDVGLIDLITDDQGNKIANPKWYKKLKREITYLHRQLSKKKEKSNNRNKARIRLARLYRDMANCRINLLHQITSKIIHENQVIVSENLKIANMVKNHKLAGSISDASWGELFRQLTYKSDWYGRYYIQIGTFFPSSKNCNNCGEKNDHLKLDDREWKCSNCHTKIDRDTNAAKNILQEGLRILNEENNLLNENSKICLDRETISDNKQKLAEALTADDIKLTNNDLKSCYLENIDQVGSMRQEVIIER